MKSSLPKVLHPVCGRPMIEYVLEAVRQAGASRILVVVGHRGDQVQAALAENGDVEFVQQREQKGTGHAVIMCRSRLQGLAGPVLILVGDAPLIRGSSLARLVQQQQAQRAACAFATAVVDDPTGLGRVLRDEQGRFVAIVEERDATPQQRTIREINPSYYVFQADELLYALDRIEPSNVQRQYYLTDCPGVLRAAGRKVLALNLLQQEEAYGVNTPEQLARVSSIMAERLRRSGA